MKTIAFAIENFSRFGGGAESYLVDLAEFFIQSGWQVHVYAERTDHPLPSAIVHPIPLPRHAPNWVRSLLFALRHRRLVRQANHDVVYGVGNTLEMDVYQSHGGVHWLSTLRKVYTEPTPVRRVVKRVLVALSLKNHVRHWIESAPFRHRPRPVVIAISEMIRRDMGRWHGIDPAGIELVYNGIDLGRFDPERQGQWRDEVRARSGIAGDETVFVFVSYELKKKGILPLVRAAARLRERRARFRVLVVGGEPDAGLVHEVERLGLAGTVLFTGPTRQVAAMYAAADAFVLPTYYDACSLAVLEAMACGLPAITTETNGIAGLLSPGTDGFVISHPPNEAELASVMEGLLDAEFRHQVGTAARAKAGRCTKRANHEAILALCERAALSHKKIDTPEGLGV